MKNTFLKGLLIVGVFVVNNAKANETLTIIATPVPQAEILEQVKPVLAKEGVDLQIKMIDDYITPNLLVANKQFDANFVQHRPHLELANKRHGTNLVELTSVEVEPMGLYGVNTNDSDKFMDTKNVKDLAPGTIIAIPDNTIDKARALFLLQDHGFIKLKSGVEMPNRSDIIDNPYKLSFYAVEPQMLSGLLLSKEVSFAVINCNYALQASFSPIKDAIFRENSGTQYPNIVVVRPNELKEKKMQKLAQALHSKEVKNFILNKYKGAVIPTF